MAQHFLLSKAAKTPSLAQVFRMTDKEAETTFKAIRWADTNGTPVCPSCGSVEAYEARRANGAPALPRARRFMLTKPRHGMASMSVSK
jgi:hypothetical protein